jgi:hypothetical protein
LTAQQCRQPATQSRFSHWRGHSPEPPRGCQMTVHRSAVLCPLISAQAPQHPAQHGAGHR